MATSLLAIELESQKEPTHSRTWSTGIRNVDKGIGGAVWTGGKVIGVASEKDSSASLVFPGTSYDSADDVAAQ
jgi:hypothetical protein